MAKGICDGLTVVEAGAGSISGSMIGMMLADNGAHVVKLEPPDGDRLRTASPNGFLVWNRGKDSVVCDLRTPAGQAQAKALIAKADVFIDGFATGVTDGWGLGYDDLRTTNPGLVYCAIRGFASTGPYAHVPAYESIVAAKAGAFSRGIFAYRPGPQFVNELMGSYGAGAMGLGSVMAALGVRDQTGRGQRVEASLYQGMNPIDYFGVATVQAVAQAAARAAANPNAAPTPAGVVASRYSFLPCTKDGQWMQFCCNLPHQFQALTRVLGISHQLEQPKFARAPIFDSAEDAAEFDDYVYEATRSMTAAEIWDKALAEPNCACEIAGPTENAMQHSQIIHNHHVIDLDDPTVGPTKQIGPIGRFFGAPSTITRGAPALGDAQRQPSGPNVPAGGQPTPAHPLAGITIVEFGFYYAMPNGVTMAAALGARVIKIEDKSGDPQRWSFGIRETGATKTMMGKESLAINLRTPEGQAVIRRILEDADVFVCGFRPGVAERMNLGYDDLKALNPRIVYLHAAGYGFDGPQAHRPIYAQAATAVAGGYYRQSGTWLDPSLADGMSVMELRAILAPRVHAVVTGDAYAALGVFAALSLAIYHQRHTGEGQFVSTTMLNGNLYGVSDDFITYDGKPPLPLMDDEQWGLNALYRCYPTAEGYVVVAATTDKEWRRLIDALGRPELADDARFADVGARKANDDALVAELTEVFGSKAASDWEAQLLPQGIACVKVTELTPSQFTVSDDGLRQSNLTFEVDDPHFGRLVREGAPGVFSETPARIAPACRIGQHTDALLTEFGYSAAEIETLKAAGAVFDEDACRVT